MYKKFVRQVGHWLRLLNIVRNFCDSCLMAREVLTCGRQVKLHTREHRETSWYSESIEHQGNFKRICPLFIK